MRRIPGVRRLPRIPHSARSIDRDIDAEVQFHLQMRIDDLMRHGQSRADAEREALREFGDTSVARDELAAIDRRAARNAGWRDTAMSIAQDVRISLRSLRTRAGFTATVLLTLALGIGANVAIFAVTYAVLVKPLPFARPDRLVHLWETGEGTFDKRSEASYLDYIDLRDRSRALAGIAGYQTRGVLLGVEHPTSVRAGAVTANFFGVLGVHPVLGRAFAVDEDAVGAARVVVLSDELWERLFARDRRAIGATIVVESVPSTVVGVLPPGFQFGGRASSPDLWIPITNDAIRRSRGAHWLNLVARLRDGATVQQATQDLSDIMRDLERTFPATNTGRRAVAVPLRDELVGSMRPLLLALYGAVAVVLLVACANVANLMLMRGADRAREMAVRIALGAGRGRLVRQLLTEAGILALSGAALAIVLAQVGIKVILGAMPRSTLESFPALASAGLDARLIGYTAALAVVAGLAFGIVPALRTSGVSIHDLLKQGARGSGARGKLRSALVIAEIALTVVLVSGATLFARSLGKLLAIDLGFRPEHITTAGVLLSRDAADPVRSIQIFDRLLASVRALPGVHSAGLVSRLPLNGGETWSFEIAGRPPAAPGREPSGSIRWVSGAYFETLGIALERGRFFDPTDAAGARRSVIVNETLARTYFPGVDPLGQTIVRRPDSLRIVGVVRDVAVATVDGKVPPTWYVPMSQDPQGFMRIAIRSDRAGASLLQQLSAALASIDPTAAVVDPATMDDLLTRSPSVFTRRFPLLLVGTFAAVSLVLALVGIYGVVSYSIRQQTRELGIRVALGASAKSVIGLYLRRSAAMAAGGVIVGVLVAIIAARSVAGMLYGVAPSDPVTYAGVAALLSLAALAATLGPALRATRVDPTIALRTE